MAAVAARNAAIMNVPAYPPPEPRPRGGAGRGLQWWSSAFSWMFGDASRLGIWVGLGLCYAVIIGAMHLVPLAGTLASGPMYFLLTAGAMGAARTTAQGGQPSFGELFGGFGPRAGALIGASLLILAAGGLVLALLMAAGAAALVSSFASLQAADPFALDPAALGIGVGTLLVMLLCLLLIVPISMAAWLAPALILLRGAAPVAALRASLAACRDNLGALTVYGLAFILLSIPATLMLGLGWLFLVPLMLLSTYAAFEDLCAAPVEVLG